MEDPCLEFNLEVFRGYMKAKQVARDMARAAAGPESIELPTGEDED